MALRLMVRAGLMQRYDLTSLTSSRLRCRTITHRLQEQAASGHQEHARTAETGTLHDAPLATSMPEAVLGTGTYPACQDPINAVYDPLARNILIS